MNANPVAVTEHKQSTPEQLYGDLDTAPPESRRLWVQEIFALDYLRHLPVTQPHQAGILDRMVQDRRDMLEKELADADPRLNRLLRTQVHHQLRARPDFQTDRLVIEQWVPAINYWLVSGSYDRHTPYATIIAELQEGDPRRRTPTERLEDRREIAAANQIANEQAGTDKVAAVIDNMSRSQISRFLEVERAIKTGETIVAHGEDESFLEFAHNQTLAAAYMGDKESIDSLASGVVDTDACVNPGHNPAVR